MKDLFNLEEEFDKAFSVDELIKELKAKYEVCVDVWEKVGAGERFMTRERLTTYAKDYKDAEERALDFLYVKYPKQLFLLNISQSIKLEEF